MSQLADAISKYNKSLESGPFRDLAWAEALHVRMEEAKLSAGGQGSTQEIQPVESGQPQTPVAGAAEIVQAVRRQEETEHRDRGIPPDVPGGAERIRVVPRLLPAGRLRCRDRVARAVGVSRARAAQGQFRN